MNKLQKLKKIAEELGYKVHEESGAHESAGCQGLYIHHACGTRTEFNPKINLSQRDEIQHHWKICVFWCKNEKQWESLSALDGYTKLNAGKIITDAIMNCIFEIIGD